VVIPALLFPKSNLGGTMRELGEMTESGTEVVTGAKCVKLQGIVKTVYQTGREANKRRVTLWIDAETMLVRQVREEDLGGAAVNVSRTTITYTPHANPQLDDTHFRFTAPTGQR
jgi:outer membrane lipoprotein-sorting protein